MTHRVWLMSPAVLLLLFAAALTGRNAVRLIRGRRDLASSLETFTNQVLAFRDRHDRRHVAAGRKGLRPVTQPSLHPRESAAPVRSAPPSPLPIERGDLVRGTPHGRAHLVDYVSPSSIRALCGFRIMPRDAMPATGDLSCQACLRTHAKRSRRLA